MRITAGKAARSTLLAAAALSLGLVASNAPAQQSGPTVLVYPANGDPPISVSLDKVHGTIRTTYYVRYSRGKTRQAVPVNGASVAEVLAAAGVADDSYAYVQTRRPDKSKLRLSRNYVSTGGDPPVIYADSNGTVHLLRNSIDSNDVNAPDWIAADGGPLTLRQQVADGLKVDVGASGRKVAAGDSVTFTATVKNGSPGERYEIDWKFGDGDSDRHGESTVEHVFGKAGSYRAQVHVVSHDDDGDGTGPTVQVGEPKASNENQIGGGSNGAPTAPSTGSFSGSSGGGSSYGSPSSSPAAPYTPTDGSTAPSAPAPKAAPPATSFGPTVSGNLLADVSTPPSAATASALRAARIGTPKQIADVDPAGVPTAAWAAIGALALMGIGASLESGRPRRLRPRRLRLRRR